jgi:hypothetical protein
MSAEAFWRVSEQVIDYSLYQRRGHRLTGHPGGVEHVNGDQIVGIGHAHGRQCATASAGTGPYAAERCLRIIGFAIDEGVPPQGACSALDAPPGVKLRRAR